jgi:guanylate kinase
MPRKGTLFILVGPSGAGKNTLMRRVQDRIDDLPQLATMTTRAMRAGEQNGREHWFVSQQEFEDLIANDRLIEWQQVHLNDLYGTPRAPVEAAINTDRDLIADIEFLGATEIHKAYPQHTILIFVTPSNLDILADRIRQRGDITPEALADRLERARFEMTFAPKCHYLVINDEREPAAETLRHIILSERARQHSDPSAASVLPRHAFHTTVKALIQHDDRVLVRAADGSLPVFSVEDPAVPPHVLLRRKLKQALGHDVTIDAISDERFDFVPPSHVSITAKPPDIYLEFVYNCWLPVHDLSGWTWQPRATIPQEAP